MGITEYIQITVTQAPRNIYNDIETPLIVRTHFGSVVAHPDLYGEVSGSSPSLTKDFKNGTYCSSACAGHNELE